MRTDNPEQDAQTFYESQIDLDIELHNCAHCDEPVPSSEINPETDYMGKSCGCQSIDFCSCGEPRKECEHCKIN